MPHFNTIYNQILHLIHITEEEIQRLRYSTRTGRPFGGEEFIKKMEKKLNKRFILQKPGRPKKVR